jgi:hypothetical protein
MDGIPKSGGAMDLVRIGGRAPLERAGIDISREGFSASKFGACMSSSAT